MEFFVTDVGLAAEREALASGRTIKIKSVVVDSVLLPDDQDPTKLTAVQLNPNDQNNKAAVYPAAGESINGKVLIAWTLPAASGDYNIKGLGFVLEDGTLWGYQRAELGYKPDPSDGAFFEPHGTVTHETSAASQIICELNLEGVHASIDDVNYLIREHHNVLAGMMRKIEGRLGRVRIYMNLNDVDPEYLPISGQTIKKVDYPDFFEHMAVTSSTLKLPDWGKHGYLRQYNSEHAAGKTLEDEIKSHDHTAETRDAGAHTPKAYPIDFGTKSGQLVLNGRFWTNTDSHNHNKGSMNINGYFSTDDRSYMMPSGGAFTTQQINSGGGAEGGDSRHARVHFNANRNWSGVTSTDSHNHYVDVNFGTKTVNINIGSYTVKMHQVADHKHDVVVNKSGGSETRPKTTVVVYAVKAKYLTALI